MTRWLPLFLILAVSAEAGEILYNGISLPDEWPPRSLDLSTGKLTRPPYLKTPPTTIPIDIGRQLFVDDFLVESTTLKRVWHQPEKYAGNPILQPETAMEREGGKFQMAAPFSDGVFFDPQDHLFKMWYHAGWFDGTALATSQDGLHWERAKTDVVPGTNRLIPDRDRMRRDGMSMWLDHTATNPAERFRMFLYTREGEIGGPLSKGAGHVLASPDGVHWEFRGLTGPCGDNTTFFYNPFRKKWVFSIRANGARVGRMRSYWECDDFLGTEKWGATAPVPWAAADELDQPDPAIGDRPQLYKLDAVAYESVMLGLFEIFEGPSNQKAGALGVPKTIDLQVGFSRDGFHWDRSSRQPFIPSSRRPGDWERGYISSAGGCCLVVGDKLHFYYGAFRGNEALGSADPFWSGMYANASTGLTTLRRDGFASMEADENPGVLTTRPVIFQGRYCFANVAAPQGELRAEVLDKDGEPIPPFTRGNCQPVSVDSTRVTLQWRGAEDLSKLTSQPVRFRFYLTKGALYSFWVSSDPKGASHGYVAAGGPEFTGPTDTERK